MRIENLWFGQGWRPHAGRLLLLPITALYSLAWQVYLVFYRLGFKKALEPHPRVICIGNLTAGGSGKTPVTLFVTDCLLKLGLQPIVSCSGYGSPASEAAQMAPEGPLNPAEWGDEPSELRDFRPALPIVVGRRRVLAAELAAKANPNSILVLDDGFQHLPLHKHLTIILDALNPANKLPFPSGPYREPRWNRSRADLSLPNDQFQIVYSSPEFVDPQGVLLSTPAEAVVLTAIARPDLFVETLKAAGVTITEVDSKPDHDPLNDPELFSRHNGKVVIVTMKDWVKLRTREDLNKSQIVIARRQASIEPKEEFIQWLKERIPE